MRPLRQQSFDFSRPGDHAEAVHGGQRHGTVLFWERASDSSRRWIKCRPDDDLPGIANLLRGQQDAFFTVNQFNGWRQVRLLRSLRAVYIDLDGQQDLDLTLDALAAAKMPAPSFAVFSGRGLHLYWLLRPTPGKAVPVWQRVQDALLKALEPLGADPACRDCTRVLRLAGTINGKNLAETRGLILTGTEWDLHSLADEVLGHRKSAATVRDLTAAQARAGRKAGPRSALQGSIYGWWHAVYSDLVKLTDLEFGNRLPAGTRDKVLFLHAVALSWFAQADAITDEILAVGRQITDFSDAEILQTMRPVIDRSQQAAVGGKVVWNGQERDPRYFFKAQTLREWIGPELLERHADHLRALAPAEVIKDRKKARDAARWGDKNTGQGVRAGNLEKRAQAREMALAGCRTATIARELGMAHNTIKKWLAD